MAPLGAGGMAEVYRARDTRLGREIALKVVNEVLSGEPDLIRRFEQEARLAGSLNHPNLVSVHDFGLFEGMPYFITELLEGESLRHRLARGRLPMRAPVHADHRFRSKPITHSGRSRSLIPEQADR